MDWGLSHAAGQHDEGELLAYDYCLVTSVKIFSGHHYRPLPDSTKPPSCVCTIQLNTVPFLELSFQTNPSRHDELEALNVPLQRLPHNQAQTRTAELSELVVHD